MDASKDDKTLLTFGRNDKGLFIDCPNGLEMVDELSRFVIRQHAAQNEEPLMLLLALNSAILSRDLTGTLEEEFINALKESVAKSREHFREQAESTK